MSDVLELIGGLVEVLCYWRFFACVIPAVVGAAALHHVFPNSTWPWFVSVPVLLVAIVGGVAWQASRPQSR